MVEGSVVCRLKYAALAGSAGVALVCLDKMRWDEFGTQRRFHFWDNCADGVVRQIDAQEKAVDGEYESAQIDEKPPQTERARLQARS